ncbi:hypothetical protein CDD81_5284 [Ophiocordyceps australis]|uniref:Amidohydrolase-related domain-containing protein n=1 Tax=Ophiocordyceps australis TaxID=1399860 RepID=A0A2C5YI16_9HYPO|nr:hypothetical protein CDD81_5284 [Ophiocordyceps australis]
MADAHRQLPIIDAHIHLWPSAEASSLAWYSPSHPLLSQQSMTQYRAATAPAPCLAGFVFVEADRKHKLDTEDWTGPLDEVRWMRRLLVGQPRDGEGHTAADASLCLGLVPWAPVPCGPDVLQRYLHEAEQAAGEAWPKVKGFRYLLQDKPAGTMLEKDFIDSLKLLGRKRFVFEVAVDQHRRGNKHLEEVVEMVGRAHQDVPEEEKVVFVLDHFGKPDLGVYNVTCDPAFIAWRTAMYTLSKDSHTYIKLSGAFAEMPESLRVMSPFHIFQALLAWFVVLTTTFGPGRLMFGSDWPLCSLDGLGDEGWDKWRLVVDKMCWMAGLDDIGRAMVFGGTAKQAYSLAD